MEKLNGLTTGMTGDAHITTAFQELAYFIDNVWVVINHKYFFLGRRKSHTLLHVWRVRVLQGSRL